MNKKLLYKKAYKLIEDATPLKSDCGSLCKSKCCQGDDTRGMILFPGEEGILENRPFLKLRKEGFSDRMVLFATCSGSCDRNFRPLSCRVFPLIPYVDAAGGLSIIEDPRAKYLCPLLMNLDGIKIDPIFRRNIRRAFRLLIQDEDIRFYLRHLSKTLDDYLRFTE